MAKTRSGLGRGLGSLLGDAPEEAVKQEKPAEQVVEKEPEPPAAPIEEVAVTQADTGDEELYSNKEDHVVIKGVVERIVDPPTRLVTEEDIPKSAEPEKAAVAEGELEVDIDLESRSASYELQERRP